jgi:hypothetical protein
MEAAGSRLYSITLQKIIENLKPRHVPYSHASLQETAFLTSNFIFKICFSLFLAKLLHNQLYVAKS